MSTEGYSINYNTIENRLKSLTKWQCDINPFQMVVAEFHFIGIEDICVCFQYGTEIFDW